MEDRTSENTGLPLGLGIGGLVLGVISLLFTCCVPLVQLPLAGIGLGLGIGGIVTSKGQKGASRILPILGTIFSGIGVVLAIAMLALIFVGAPILGESFRQKIEEIEQRERAKNEFEIDLNDSPGQ